ncbi:MAG: cytochrome b/b6 domain-containing protein, partial [Burkholderiaceae bacterium]
IWHTLRSTGSSPLRATAGHSAIGTLSVYALLIVLAVQVSTGVFTNDGTFTEGPWVKFVSSAISDRLSTIHYYNHWLVLGLSVVHVAAIGFYLLVRRDDLITPMITGDKLGLAAPAAEDGAAIRLRAAVLAMAAAGIVSYLVML